MENSDEMGYPAKAVWLPIKPKSPKTVNIVPKNLKYNIKSSPTEKSYLLIFVTSISSAAHFSTPKILKISLEKQGFRGIAVLVEGKNKIS